MTFPALPPVAFVTPWYGPDIPGGMEAETRRTAEHLAAAGLRVEVLTTCIRDFYADWGKNAHRPGATVHNGVTVRRFAVRRRKRAAFDAVNARLMAGRSVTPAEEQTYIREMFACPDLFDYLQRRNDDTLLIFIPYMFATTVMGVPIWPQRAIVIPCLHDEAYARMAVYRRVLPQARALLLHTYAERDLAERLLGPAGAQLRLVVGEGVDGDWSADGAADREGARFRHDYNLAGPLVLYVGRREPGKNTPLLLRHWARYVAERQSAATLLLVGPGDVGPLPAQTRDLGFVPRQTKYDALAAADCFVLPSVNESFSIAIMESWLAGTPVLVNGACAVTKEHVLRSNGGLYFDNYAEFAAALDRLLADRPLAQRLGEQGRRYVRANYRWPTIVERYIDLLTVVASQEQPA